MTPSRIKVVIACSALLFAACSQAEPVIVGTSVLNAEEAEVETLPVSEAVPTEAQVQAGGQAEEPPEQPPKHTYLNEDGVELSHDIFYEPELKDVPGQSEPYSFSARTDDPDDMSIYYWLELEDLPENRRRCESVSLSKQDINRILIESEDVEFGIRHHDNPAFECWLSLQFEIEGEIYFFDYRTNGFGTLIAQDSIVWEDEENKSGNGYFVYPRHFRSFWYRKCDIHMDYLKWYEEMTGWSPTDADFDSFEDKLDYVQG